MRRMGSRLARLAAGVGIAAALLVPLNAAAAGSIQVVSATLVAKGAEVDVTVSFTCTVGDTIPNFPGGAVQAFVQQAVSKTQQASGFGGTSGQACTGSPESAVLHVLANISGPPFRTGPAVVNASINECDAFFNCTFSSSGLIPVRITK